MKLMEMSHYHHDCYPPHGNSVLSSCFTLRQAFRQNMTWNKGKLNSWRRDVAATHESNRIFAFIFHHHQKKEVQKKVCACKFGTFMFQVGCSCDVSMTCSLHTRNSRLLFLILDSHISSFINFLSFSPLYSRPLCNLRTSLIRPFMHIWRHNNTILHISSITHSSKRLLRLSHPHSFGFSNASRFNGSLARASNGRATSNVAISITINQPMHTRRSVWAQIEFLSRSFPYCFCRILTRHSW